VVVYVGLGSTLTLLKLLNILIDVGNKRMEGKKDVKRVCACWEIIYK
jgi:hypothetical protein